MTEEKIREIKLKLIEKKELSSISKEDLIYVLDLDDEFHGNPDLFIELVDIFGNDIVEHYVPSTNFDIGDSKKVIYSFTPIGEADLLESFHNQQLYKKVLDSGYVPPKKLGLTNQRLSTEILFHEKIFEALSKEDGLDDVSIDEARTLISAYRLSSDKEFMTRAYEKYGPDILQVFRSQDPRIIEEKIKRGFIDVNDIITIGRAENEIIINIDDKSVNAFDYLIDNENGYLTNILDSDEAKRIMTEASKISPLSSNKKLMNNLIDIIGPEIIVNYHQPKAAPSKSSGVMDLAIKVIGNYEKPVDDNPIHKAVNNGFVPTIELVKKNPSLLEDYMVAKAFAEQVDLTKLPFDELKSLLDIPAINGQVSQEQFKVLLMQHGKEMIKYFYGNNLEAIEEAVKNGSITISIEDFIVHSNFSKSEVITESIIDSVLKLDNPELIEKIFKKDHPKLLLDNKFLSQNDDVMKHLISIDSSFVESYRGITEELFQFALEQGYKVDLNLLAPSRIFSNNTIMHDAFLEQGLADGFFKSLDQMDPIELKSLHDARMFVNSSYMERLIVDVDPRYINEFSSSKVEVFDFAFEHGYKYVQEEKKKSRTMLKSAGFKNQLLKDILGDDYSGFSPEEVEKISSMLNVLDNYNLVPTVKEMLNPQILKGLGIETVDKLLRYSVGHNELKYIIEFSKQNKIDDFMEFYKIIDSNFDNDKAMGIDKFLKSVNLYQKLPTLVNEIKEKVANGQELTVSEKNNLRYLIDNPQEIKEGFNLEDLSNLSQVRHDEFIKNFNEGRINFKHDSDRKKDAILYYLTGRDIYDNENLFENLINCMSLTYMIQDAKKAGNTEVEVEATYMYAIINVIEQIKDVQDEKILDNLADILSKMPLDKLDGIIDLFDNIEEKARALYELEANSQLTDIENLKQNEEFCRDTEFTITSESGNGKPYTYNAKVIDLSHTKYTLYTHVYSAEEASMFFDRNDGHQFLCTSVQTDIHESSYGDITKEGVQDPILIFSHVPKGNFVLSSVRNLSSNSSMSNNDFELRELAYSATPIRQSYLTEAGPSEINHSETLLFRDGLIPTGIVLSGEIPTEKEIKAKEDFEREIEKHTGVKTELPYVKIQRNRSRVFDYRQKIKKSLDKNPDASVEDRTEFIRKLFDLGESTTVKLRTDYIEKVVNRPNLKKELGVDDYRAYTVIDGEVYMLRIIESPKDVRTHEINKTAVGIQKLVHGEDYIGALDVKTIEHRSTDSKGNEEVTMLEAVKRSTARELVDYSLEEGRLGGNPYPGILREFMVDHLLCNYFSGNEAFVMDDENKVFGVNKETSFRDADEFYDKDGKPYTSMSFYYFNAINGNNFYRKVFTDFIQSGENEVFTSKDLEDFRQKAYEISEMPDEEYLELFDGILNEEETPKKGVSPEVIKEVALARKNNLGRDADEFIERITYLREVAHTVEKFDSPEKIAFINDVHGNVSALKSLLDECKKQGRTDVFILGDLIGFGPHSAESLEILKDYSDSLNIRTVLGNHELYCVMGDRGFKKPISGKRAASEIEQTQFIRSQLSSESRTMMEAMPLQRDIMIGDKTIELTHFPHSRSTDDRLIFGEGHGEDNTAIKETKSGSGKDYLIYGHEHRTLNTTGDEIGTVGMKEKNGTTFMNLPSSGCVHGTISSLTVLKQDENGNLVPEVVPVKYNREQTIEGIRNDDGASNSFGRFFGGDQDRG